MKKGQLALRMSKALAAVTLVTLLSACSSGGSTPADSGSPAGNPTGNVPQTPTIEGIATPSSVSVVTATNAG